MKKVKALLLAILLIVTCTIPAGAYSINTNKPMAHKSQVVQFCKKRHASKAFMNQIDFIYDYSKKIGIDPTIVIAISSIETGYGKSNLFRNYNNPGGIKARHGWHRFKTLKDGYRYMIRLLGTYSGKVNKRSWQYGKAKTTQALGNYYWVENGCDRGYHKQLTRQINSILSYPIKKSKPKKAKTIKSNKKKQVKIPKTVVKKKPNAMDYIKSRLNHKNDNYGMKMILNSLKK